MIKCKTSSGFACEIDETVMNDWEMMEYMCDIEDKPQLIVKVIRKVLGDKQYKEIKAFHKENLTVEVMNQEFVDICNSIGKVKN